VHLVAGLGNPGARYARNRHNAGFMVIDRFAAEHGAESFRERFQGSLAKLSVAGNDVLLLKPATFMNLSGRSVQQALHFFKLGLADLVVVYDEVDLAFGTLKVKRGGGTAGHRGVASIVETCGGQDFCRLRVGIGRPQAGGAVDRHVLSDFSGAESQALPTVLERASAALTDIVVRGAQAAMNVHNQKTD
jgi:PTH1 family peptidyl-tRNA hydrolase